MQAEAKVYIYKYHHQDNKIQVILFNKSNIKNLILLGGSVVWRIVPYTKRLRGSIPRQGTYLYLGCGFDP